MANKDTCDAAVTIAKEWLSKQGWENVKKAPRGSGYDLIATREAEEWHVEVKGTSKKRPPFRYITQCEFEACKRDRWCMILITGIHGDHHDDPKVICAASVEAHAKPEIVYRVDAKAFEQPQCQFPPR